MIATNLLPIHAAVRYPDPLQDVLVAADSLVMGRPYDDKGLPYDLNTGLSLVDGDYQYKVSEYLGGGRTLVVHNAEKCEFPMKLTRLHGMNAIMLAECYVHAHCMLQEGLWLYENYLSDEHPHISDRYRRERSYIYPEDDEMMATLNNGMQVKAINLAACDAATRHFMMENDAKHKYITDMSYKSWGDLNKNFMMRSRHDGWWTFGRDGRVGGRYPDGVAIPDQRGDPVLVINKHGMLIPAAIHGPVQDRATNRTVNRVVPKKHMVTQCLLARGIRPNSDNMMNGIRLTDYYLAVLNQGIRCPRDRHAKSIKVSNMGARADVDDGDGYEVQHESSLVRAVEELKQRCTLMLHRFPSLRFDNLAQAGGNSQAELTLPSGTKVPVIPHVWGGLGCLVHYVDTKRELDDILSSPHGLCGGHNVRTNIRGGRGDSKCKNVHFVNLSLRNMVLANDGDGKGVIPKPGCRFALIFSAHAANVSAEERDGAIHICSPHDTGARLYQFEQETEANRLNGGINCGDALIAIGSFTDSTLFSMTIHNHEEYHEVLKREQEAAEAEHRGLGMALRVKDMDANLDPRVQNGTHYYCEELRRIIDIDHREEIEAQIIASREAPLNQQIEATLGEVQNAQNEIDLLARDAQNLNRQLTRDESDLPGDSPTELPNPLDAVPASRETLMVEEYPIGESQIRVLPNERPWESQYVDTFQGLQEHSIREYGDGTDAEAEEAFLEELRRDPMRQYDADRRRYDLTRDEDRRRILWELNTEEEAIHVYSHGQGERHPDDPQWLEDNLRREAAKISELEKGCVVTKYHTRVVDGSGGHTDWTVCLGIRGYKNLVDIKTGFVTRREPITRVTAAWPEFPDRVAQPKARAHSIPTCFPRNAVMERELKADSQMIADVPHADEFIHRRPAPALFNDQGEMVRRSDVMGPGAAFDANHATTLAEEQEALVARQQQINEAMPVLERRVPSRHSVSVPPATRDKYLRRDERAQEMATRGRPTLSWREQEQDRRDRAARPKRGRSPPEVPRRAAQWHKHSHPTRAETDEQFAEERSRVMTKRGRSTAPRDRTPSPPPAGPKPKAARRADSRHAKRAAIAWPDDEFDDLPEINVRTDDFVILPSYFGCKPRE